MDKTVGVFAGSSSSFNIVLATSHIGQALSDEFTCHLISTNKTVIEEAYQIYNEVYGETNPDSIFGAIIALQSYLNNANPDVLVQITNPPLHGTIVGTLGALHGIPSVYRYSGDRFNVHKLSNYKNKPLHFLLNNIIGRVPLKFADHYIAMGPYGKAQLQKQGIPGASISIVPPSVELERINTDDSVEMKTDRHILLFLGRISRRKGIRTLNRTIPIILDQQENLEFVFVGEQRGEISVADKYYNNITLVGPVSPDKVPKYLNTADILIHPSLIEGLPRTVLEALATNTPPIARDVGDIAFATNNTFSSDLEFVDMVRNFHQLSADPIDRFLLKNIKQDYIDIIYSVTKHNSNSS